MILSIFLLILFLLLLILMTFFTIYFIIPSIEKEKRIDDAIIPHTTAPLKLPRQRLITPYDTMEFIDSIIEPISMEKKLQILKDNSSPDDEKKKITSSSEKSDSDAKKHFKIWEYCYRIVKRFMKSE